MIVLKRWAYAQMIFRSEKLQISYPKAEIGTYQKGQKNYIKSASRGAFFANKS